MSLNYPFTRPKLNVESGEALVLSFPRLCLRVLLISTLRMRNYKPVITDATLIFQAFRHVLSPVLRLDF